MSNEQRQQTRFKHVSGADLALLLGIDARTVRKLVEKKVLHPIGKDVFDLGNSIQAFIAHREGVIAAEHGLGDFGKARADLYQEKAEMARMQREKMQGKLLPVEAVTMTWRNIITHVRGSLLALPSKLAPRLLAKTNAAEVQDILRVGVYECLESLVETEIKHAPRANGGGDDAHIQA
jgi:phage terminase Nu1 subunit (DNA packaging protein)